MSATAERTIARPTTPATNPARAGVADPGPLGLAAFALTTMLLSLANAGLVGEAGATAVAMALFYGGLTQFAAGLWEFARGNTFGATAFTSYGAFWLAFWWLRTAPGLAEDAGSVGVGFFLLAWTIFTALMTVAAAKTNGATLTVFVLLTLTFVALSIGDLAGAPGATQTGGWLGLATAAVALYTSWAGVTNATWKRDVLPVWPRA
ncbi:succinate-acetate transporter protein [Leifsonia sp. EB41]|uniref:acetate uptake transporter n=1 Tax=Leifsonia sp. EB41 TaxID=3156260 RepID=UPI0035162832